MGDRETDREGEVGRLGQRAAVSFLPVDSGTKRPIRSLFLIDKQYRSSCRHQGWVASSKSSLMMVEGKNTCASAALQMWLWRSPRYGRVIWALSFPLSCSARL